MGSEIENDVQFKGNDPGATKYGNFINYYSFHPPENRITLFPTDIWNVDQNKFVGLDIGCNSGNLTQHTYNFLTDKLNKNTEVHMLGIDIDPLLIIRANENNTYKINIIYKQLDYMNDKERQNTINSYKNELSITRFNAIFCFSITMWIHLNHGDEGLKRFLKTISDSTDLIVIEPQPWKCYKSAVRRMKRSNFDFPLFKSLKIRENILLFIDEYLQNECKLDKIRETILTGWGRKIIFYKNNQR